VYCFLEGVTTPPLNFFLPSCWFITSLGPALLFFLLEFLLFRRLFFVFWRPLCCRCEFFFLWKNSPPFFPLRRLVSPSPRGTTPFSLVRPRFGLCLVPFHFGPTDFFPPPDSFWVCHAFSIRGRGHFFLSSLSSSPFAAYVPGPAESFKLVGLFLLPFLPPFLCMIPGLHCVSASAFASTVFACSFGLFFILTIVFFSLGGTLPPPQ